MSPRPRLRRLAPALLLPLALAACGDEAKEDPDAIVCDSSQKVKVVGGVGDVSADYAAGALEGVMTPRRITIDLGEVEYLPQGAEEPDTRSRILVFQTNVSDPNGRELFANLDLYEEDADGERQLDLVSRPLDTYCSVQDGKLCARFGLDDGDDGELVEDNVAHEATSGSFTVTALTANVLRARWSMELGPNLQNEFDTSEGQLEGCFDAIVGPSQGENTFPLE